MFGDIARAAKKQAVGHLHNVGLVYRMNFLAVMLASIRKGKLRDACRGLFGDDLNGLDHPRHNFMLDAYVLAFRVFANDDQIDAWIMGRQARKILDGSKIGVQLKVLAQDHID